MISDATSANFYAWVLRPLRSGFAVARNKFCLDSTLSGLTPSDPHSAAQIIEHPTFKRSLRLAVMQVEHPRQASMIVRRLHLQTLSGAPLVALLDYEDQLLDALSRRAVAECTHAVETRTQPGCLPDTLMPYLREFYPLGVRKPLRVTLHGDPPSAVVHFASAALAEAAYTQHRSPALAFLGDTAVARPASPPVNPRAVAEARAASFRRHLLAKVRKTLFSNVLRAVTRTLHREVVEPKIDDLIAMHVDWSRHRRESKRQRQEQADEAARSVEQKDLHSVGLLPAGYHPNPSPPRRRLVSSDKSDDESSEDEDAPQRRDYISSSSEDEQDMDVDEDDNDGDADSMPDNEDASEQLARLTQRRADAARRAQEAELESEADKAAREAEAAAQEALDKALDEPLRTPVSLDQPEALAQAQQEIETWLASATAEDVEFVIAALFAQTDRKAKDHAPAYATQYLPALLRALRAELASLDAESQLIATSVEHKPTAEPNELSEPPQVPKVIPHATGCARAEGYYFVSAETKRANVATGRQQVQKVARTATRDNRRQARHVTSALASTGNMNLAAEVGLIQQLKDIPANEVVIEYVGEVIRQSVADERERRYTQVKIGSSYLFRIDELNVIDATRRGHIARFMNHSCDVGLPRSIPNTPFHPKVFESHDEKHIVIYSKRDIREGQEITYDYQFPMEDEKIPCYCGAENCKGFLN
ncbi:uncharacterized protein MONBRDRAFT_10803 [Monosiga brevicollis MX1]|uniref:[histone H3]-lysine(4) N-trimethyltransferase n=1 Tax=Monosiga brevicollis TaxID=81824 RepID=A9V7A2_MONBE|nr:uncharacterized protein MONBRDRAFT_10803 [Monosiga brevicollis MX1]EDQ86548.1 predicted protein [Monosiga brevicollis MX1]|eukprot:XP_001748661.1 hypothetical protein [Monosiga brevicollis MX1]